MNNKTLYIGLIIIIIAIGVLAYFDYNIYSEKQMQSYMIQASAYNTSALNQNTSLSNAVNKSNYDSAIQISTNRAELFQQALDCDNKAIKYANGIYKEYLTYDIMRLKMDIKLSNTQIQAFDYAKNNNLNGILSLNDQMKEYDSKARDYRDKEDEILAANPDKFKFLNS